MVKFFFFTWIILFAFSMLLYRWANKETARCIQQEAKPKKPTTIHITIEKVKTEQS